MVVMSLADVQDDDPRRLRALLERVLNLADDHQLDSVIVGLSGLDDDEMFPEVVRFVGSALRVDDSIFRMTRSRAVFFLADADLGRAKGIMERVLRDFEIRFPTADTFPVALSYFAVSPGMEVALKDVLPALFAPPADAH